MHVRRAAVTSRIVSKGIELFTDGSTNDQGASRFGAKSKARRRRASASSFEAPGVTLDGELRSLGALDASFRAAGGAVIVVKLDVEGMEAEALEGMARGMQANAYAAVVFEYDPERVMGSMSERAPPTLKSIVRRLSTLSLRCYVASAARSFLRADVPKAWEGYDVGNGPVGKGKSVNLLCAPDGNAVDALVRQSMLLCVDGGGEGTSSCECWDDESAGERTFDRAISDAKFGGVVDAFKDVEKDIRFELRSRGWPIL